MSQTRPALFTAVCLHFAVCLSFMQVAEAQVWREAIAVTNDGDTLHGEVRFSDPDVSPSQVEFRQPSTSTPLMLEPDKIKSLFLPEIKKRFEPLTAEIEILYRTVVPEGRSPVESRENVNVFAEVLVAGKDMTLYSLFDRFKTERFFVRKDGLLTEVTFPRYQTSRGGAVYQANQPLYKSQVRQLVYDCPEVASRNVDFDVKSLTRIVDAYIRCKGDSITFLHEPAMRPIFMVGLTGAMLFRREDGKVGSAGLLMASAQVLSRKFDGNRFIWLGMGATIDQQEGSEFVVEGLMGAYFGKGDVRPLLGAGISNVQGFLVAAAGVAIKKRAALSTLYYGGGIFSFRLSIFPNLRAAS